MSSAAKLRKYGRGTATVAAAALVMTSFGPAAFASWDDAPQTPSVVDPLRTDGTIGLVDADQPTAKTQGATMVNAGQDGQAISDVRFVLPNRFKKGDTIDLRLFDRSATEEAAGNTNSGPSTKVAFSAAPKVASVALSNDDTTVAATNPGGTANGAASNTESTLANPWVAAAGDTGTKATRPSVTPAFDVSLFANGSHGYNDGVRLTVNTDASTGDEDAVWVVTLEDLKVDLGAKVTPGELRLVPFAWNTNVKPVASPWFYGNAEFNDNGTVSTADDVQREIGIYTVPAYVSPVKIEYGNRDIVADGLAQNIGDITLSETQDFAWKDGDLVLKIGPTGVEGVTIASPASQLTVTVNGKAVTLPTNAVSSAQGTITIPVSGTRTTINDTVTIKGIQLSSKKAQEITYSIDGAKSTAVNDWLADPAGTSPEVLRDGGRYAYRDLAFINQAATTNAALTSGEVDRPITIAASFPVRTAPATATPPAPVVGGLAAGENILRSAGTLTPTATLGALTGAGGQTTLNLVPGTLVQNGDGSFNGTYTGNVPGLGNNNLETYTFTNLVPGLAVSVAVTDTVSSTPAGITAITQNATATNTLPAGDYTISAGATGARTLTGQGLTLNESSTAGTFHTDAANAVPGADAVVLTGLAGTTAAATQITVGATFVGSRAAGAVAAVGMTQVTGTGTLPDADYTVAADGSTITGGGVVMTRQGTSTVYRVTTTGGTGAVSGDEYSFNGIVNGGVYRVVSEAITGVYGGAVTVTSGANNLLPGTYTVTAVGADFTVARTSPGGGPTVTNVQNNVAKAADWDINAGTTDTSVTFTGLANGQTFVVQAGLPTGLVSDRGVNQTDIEAPLNALAATGVAKSESGRIGGNNRYETAAKIAESWANGDKSNRHGKVRNAIIASGENFPDALSASYLSQRMGAPILLTQKGSLPADTIEALRDRQVDKVFIVGGPAAVSNNVQEQLANLNTYRWGSSNPDGNAAGDDGSLETTGAKLQVQRLSSANPQNDTRYTTNQLVNMYAAAWGGNRTIGKTVYKAGEAGKYTAIFARGDNFPDALAAGVLTAGMDDGNLNNNFVNATNDQALPLILTSPTELSANAKEQIERLDVQHGLIIGSENAVSDAVKKSMEDMGLTDSRIGGADRYFTAAAVAEFAMRNDTPSAVNQFPGLGFIDYDANGVPLTSAFGETNAWLANGLKFPDALTAAPWLGRNGDVLNLTMGTNDLSDGTKDFLTKRAADIVRVNALGLGDAVSSKVLTEANQIASSK